MATDSDVARSILRFRLLNQLRSRALASHFAQRDALLAMVVELNERTSRAYETLDQVLGQRDLNASFTLSLVFIGILQDRQACNELVDEFVAQVEAMDRLFNCEWLRCPRDQPLAEVVRSKLYAQAARASRT